MAPPGERSRKVGLKRIDAALDALRPMGFPQPVVRSTVKKLLKAYGGDEGWTFIEENAYRLLIETILEEQENPEGENSEPKLLENSEPKLLIENGGSKNDVIQDNIGPLGHFLGDHSEGFQSPSVQFPPVRRHAAQVHTPLMHSAEPQSTIIKSSPVVDAVPSSVKEETSHVKNGREFCSSQSSVEVSVPRLFSPLPVGSLPSKRRKPCYGWLSSDDEEEQELVYLPAT